MCLVLVGPFHGLVDRGPAAALLPHWAPNVEVFAKGIHYPGHELPPVEALRLDWCGGGAPLADCVHLLVGEPLVVRLMFFEG